VKPGYKQTEVGVIPEDWDIGELGLFWSVTDCKHVTAPFIANGFPIASIREVQSHFVDLTNAKQTTQQFYTLLIESGRKPNIGDLILSRNATVGEVAQVAEWHPPFAMGQDVCLLRKKSPHFSTNYLQSVFRSSIIANQLSDLMVGSTFKRANIEQIKNLVVPMPPTAEQEAIAEALSDADALIESLTQLIAKKRQIKQGAMQELLTGKRRLHGFANATSGYKQTEVGVIPENWEVCKLGELSSLSSGTTPARNQYDRYYRKGSIHWVKTLDLNNSDVIDTDELVTDKAVEETSLHIFPIGTVLVAMYGGFNQIGRTGLLQIPAAVNQAITAIRPQVDKLQPAYLLATLNFKVDYWKIVASSSRKDPNITSKDIRDFSIAYPRLPEQEAIAEVLSEMDAELATLESKLAKARQLKQGMMHNLLTGRIRLR
jgi:type I restriction enzyme, S subunit